VSDVVLGRGGAPLEVRDARGGVSAFIGGPDVGPWGFSPYHSECIC
jgi:hypothetical protein